VIVRHVMISDLFTLSPDQTCHAALVGQPPEDQAVNSSQWNIGRNSAFGCTACLQDVSGSTLVVPLEVKVQPGRSAIQYPQPRRDAVGDHLLRVSRIGPTIPGPEPHALPLGDHLTAPASTAAAGAVANVFRALGLGTKKRYVLDSAISAASAFEQKGFSRVLKQL
jgi:hypothetical protein